MEHQQLKRILTCCSIAGLLAAAVVSPGCSNQEDSKGKAADQETLQQPVVEDEDTAKAKKPDGTEVKIRGKSG